MTNNHSTTLLLGGTGKTGRRVAERLAARDVPVRIGSRSGQPPFDWDDQRTWAAALDGVDSVYVSYYPDLAAPGAYAAVLALVGQAVDRGVQRLVLLSGRGEPEAARSEKTVQESGVDWTIVRSSFFAQNFSEHFMLEPVLSGVIAMPAGDLAEPFIDVEDIADIAAAALTDPRHAGQAYDVTGPRLLTFADAAAEIAKASGRDVQYVPVSAEEWAAGALEAGVPADEVAFLVDLFAEILDGRNAHVSDGVERALGRPARDFSDYARLAAATGVWAG